MMKEYGLKFIRFDESLFERIHPSWFHYRKRLLISVGLLVLACFLSYPLFQWGWIGVLIFVGILCVSALNIFFVSVLRSMTVCLVTNQRIIDIDRHGLFEKHVAELPLGHIQEIRYTTKGILASLAQYGTVIIQGKIGYGRMEIVDVHYPSEIQELLVQIQKQHSKINTQSQVSS